MAIPRQIIVDLVEGDLAPPLSIRFDGLDLADYTTKTFRVEREDGSKFSRAITPDGTDAELGTVAWQSGDLVAGTHKAECELVQQADSKNLTLPRKYPIILNVRRDLG